MFTDVGYPTPLSSSPPAPALASWRDACTTVSDVPKASQSLLLLHHICLCLWDPSHPLLLMPWASQYTRTLCLPEAMPTADGSSQACLLGRVPCPHITTRVPVESCLVLPSSHLTFCEKRSFHFYQHSLLSIVLFLCNNQNLFAILEGRHPIFLS